MKPVLKQNGLEREADEDEELGRSQGPFVYVMTSEVLNENDIGLTLMMCPIHQIVEVLSCIILRLTFLTTQPAAG